MRSRFFFAFFLFAALPLLASEPDTPSPSPSESVYIVRTGERLVAPYTTSYRLVEYVQLHGRWIFPDVGYYDIGHLSEQLWFAAAGGEVYRGAHARWTQEVYFSQEAGSAAKNQRSLWIWPVVDLRFTPRLSAETVVYPTVPLNCAQRWGFDVDRSKLEYLLRRNLTVGAGYAATVGAETDWQNKPFLTTTVNNRTGSWEFWVQRINGGAQLQARYQLERRGGE